MAKSAANREKTVLSVVYFPQLGYLVGGRDLQADVAFSIKGKNYYKTKEMARLDGELGDIETSLHGKETEIINGLYQHIQHVDFSYLVDFIGEVDAICAMALFAEAYGGAPPTFTDAEVVEVGAAAIPNAPRRGKARHVQPWSVSNNYFGKRCILPGGTPVLCEIGQIAAMAQAGFYLPFATLKLPLFDRILVKPRKRESLKEGVSTFHAEMLAIKDILLLHTPNTLCLVDDPGRGTNLSDGISLFMAFSELSSAKILFAATSYSLSNSAVGDASIAGLPYLRGGKASSTGTTIPGDVGRGT